MKVISDYDYITNISDYDYEDYDYIASESHDYLRSCNRLQSITITPSLIYVLFNT